MSELEAAPRHSAYTWLRVLVTGGMSLRREVALSPEEPEEIEAEAALRPGPDGDYERFLPPSVYTLRENVERNPQYLRESFAYMLGIMADAYDSLDHQNSPSRRGTELQDDCQAVRELSRRFDIPPQHGTDSPVGAKRFRLIRGPEDSF